MLEKCCIVRFTKNQFADTGELSDKSYAYRTTEVGLKPKDALVVQTKYGIGIAYFERYTVCTEDLSHATSWIIQKVDMQAFEEKMVAFEKKQALLAEMRQVYESSAELEIYKQLAESSPQMKALYESFLKLSN